MKLDDLLSEFHRRHLKHIGGPESVKEAQKELDVVQNLLNDK